MSDAISVSIRLRPPIKRESGFRNDWRVNGNTISQISKSSVVYAFDQVFDQITSTEDVYGSFAKPVILSVMEGFNGTIFAYGQTASGKTHTMMGDDSCPGIIPQAIDEIFTYIDQHPNREFCLVVSYMEIYNEVITDLLSTNKKNLKIGEDVKGKVWVKDLTATPINSSEQVMDLMAQGEKHRHFGQTLMNERSSRSHTIFQMQIESRDTNEEDDGAVRAALLNLVDLAGSERVSSTGAEGVRFKEGCNINSSLMALGTVISNLSEGESFIPFRNSKLTRILQNSLGGNAKTGIICTITPAAIDETASTLNFASRAKKIKNKPEINEVLDDASIIKRYKRQIKELEEQLNSNTKIEELKNENEMMAQALEEQTRMRRNQEEKLQKLTTFFCTSGGLPKRNFAKRAKRRETWCPGAGLLPLPLLARTPGTKPCDLSVPNILEEQERLVSEEVPPPAAGTAHDISLSSSYNAKEVQCDLQSEIIFQEVQQLRKTLQAKIDDLEHMTFLYYEREVNVEDAHNRLRENTEIQQQLRDKNQEHKQRIEELTFELDLASAEIDRLQDNAPSSDDALDIQNIKEENEKLNDTIRKLQDELNTSRSSLEQNKKTCEAKMEEVTNNLRQSTEEQHQLSHKVQRQQQRIEELTCELDLARGELEKNSMEEVTDRLPQSTEIHQLLDKNQEQQQRMEELACELELAKGVLEKNQEQQQLIEELTCELELAKGELEKKQEQQQCIEELTCELELTKGELEKNQEQQQRIKELTCELELAKVELERNKEQQQRIEELTCELELAKGELEKNQEQQQRIKELTCELELAKVELERNQEQQQRIKELTCELELAKVELERNKEQQQRIEELTCELELAKGELEKNQEQQQRIKELTCELELAKVELERNKEQQQRIEELTCELELAKGELEKQGADTPELEVEKGINRIRESTEIHQQLREKNQEQQQRIEELTCELELAYQEIKNTEERKNYENSEHVLVVKADLERARDNYVKLANDREEENNRLNETIRALQDELKSSIASLEEAKKAYLTDIEDTRNLFTEKMQAQEELVVKLSRELEKAYLEIREGTSSIDEEEVRRSLDESTEIHQHLREKNQEQQQRIEELTCELELAKGELEKNQEQQQRIEELTCKLELAKGELERNQEQQQRIGELTCELELAKVKLERNQEQQQRIGELTCELELAKGELEKNQEQQQRIKELTCELELTKGELEKNQEQQQRIGELTCELELAKGELEKNQEQQQRIKELTCELELSKGELEKQGTDTLELEVEEAMNRIRESTEIHQQLREKNQEQQQRIEELTCELELAYQEIKNTEERKNVEISEELNTLKADLDRAKYDNLKLANDRKEENDRQNETIRTLQEKLKSITSSLEETKKTCDIYEEEAKKRVHESTEKHQQLREKNQEQQQRIEGLTCELELAKGELDKNQEQQQRIEELTCELELAKGELEKNQEQQQRIKELTCELELAKGELEKYQEQQQRIKELTCELELAKVELGRNKEQQQRIEELTCELELAKGELEKNQEQQQRIKELTCELELAKVELGRNKEQQQRIEELTCELELAKGELEKQGADTPELEVEEARNRIRESTEIHQQLREKNQEQQQRIEELTCELELAYQEIKNTEERKSVENSEELIALKADLERAKYDNLKLANYRKEENDRLNETIRTLQDEVKSLTTRLDETKQKSEELAACKSELKKAKEEIEKAWTLYDKEKDRLEKINWQMTDELQEKELENDRQYQTIIDLKDDLKSLMTRLEETKQNQNGSEELAACRSELKKAKEEIEKAWALYDKEKDRLEKLNWQMTDELQEKELENDRQYQTIVDLKDELKSLKASPKEIKQNQNGLSEELAACKSELEKAKEEIEKAWALYDKEKDRLEKINWQMTDELQEKELENDRQYQKIVDLKDELKSLTASLEERKQNQNGSEELATCRSELEKAKGEIEKAWTLYDKEKDRLEKLNGQLIDELKSLTSVLDEMKKESENDAQCQKILDLKGKQEDLSIQLANRNMQIMELQCTAYKQEDTIALLNREVEYQRKRAENMANDANKLREERERKKDAAAADGGGVVSSVAVFTLKAKVIELEKMVEKLKKENEHLERDRDHQALLKTDRGHQIRRLEGEIYQLQGKLRKYRGERPVLETSNRLQDVAQESDLSTIKSKSAQELEAENRRAHSSWLSPSKTKDLMEKESPLEQLQDQCKQQ
ncbi:kinesin-like protein KIN-7O isoform X3 [Nematostella vectensis]|uniref:kinesin-like protein KIN-7O isoform X3 n=1 Tax=Nematostella vectensis TaxID=45351 RepID=UPI0020771742|nr:kinesin-like protein KIN-7O isoform X3 [Nematostella vectensis]